MLRFLPFALAVTYVLLCPFNKVEESFHLQATHDVLIHGTASDAYDHLEFPGVVPRTFLGALTLAALTWPWKCLCAATGSPKMFLQIAVRVTLAALVCLSYARVVDATGKRFGSRTARAMIFVAALSPHFLYYASRTLPNTFALALVTNGFAEWMLMGVAGAPDPLGRSSPPRLVRAIAWFVCAIVWFRCDMLVLLAPVVLAWLFLRRATFPQLVWNGTWIGMAALLLTVAVDSVLWRKLLWPEGIVLFFNTVANRSHEYGVSPFHWYFTSALPRSLLGMLAFIPFAVVTLVEPRAAAGCSSTPATAGHLAPLKIPGTANPGVRDVGGDGDDDGGGIEEFFWSRHPHQTLRQLLLQRARLDLGVAEFLLPALGFVALYSALPHKELRFLLPAMPLFHVVVARGLAKALRFGEALLRGLHAVHRPGPEAAAAEMLSDAVETALGAAVPPAVAAVVATPQAHLRRRHRRQRIETQRSLDVVSRASLSLQLQRELGSMTGSVPPHHPASATAAIGRSRPGIPSYRQDDNASGAAPEVSDPEGSAAGSSQPAFFPLSTTSANEGAGPSAPLSAAGASLLPQLTEAAEGETDADADGDCENEDVAAAWRAQSGRVSLVRRLLGAAVLGGIMAVLLLNAGATVLFVRVSMANYPGGEALQRLYTLYAAEVHGRMQLLRDHNSAGSVAARSPLLPPIPAGKLPVCPAGDVTATVAALEWWRQCIDAKAGCPAALPWTPGSSDAFAATPPVCGQPGATNTHAVSVHIDVAAAETGVCRFGEAWSAAAASTAGGGGAGWLYSKAERLTTPEQFARFDYLLTANASRHAGQFDTVESVPGFVRVDWRRARIVQAPLLYVMRRKDADVASRRQRLRAQADAADAQAAAAHARARSALGAAQRGEHAPASAAAAASTEPVVAAATAAAGAGAGGWSGGMSREEHADVVAPLAVDPRSDSFREAA